MNLIVETDIGRDPDDFFALCYLVMAGVNIRAITISPGDHDQVAVAMFLTRELGLEIPIGSANPDRTKSSVGGVHLDILNRYQWPHRVKPDGRGGEIIADTMSKYPDCEFFVCGPLESVGDYIRQHPDHPQLKATMQGGFVGYHLHRPAVTLEKFEGKDTVPTFNLNGDVESGKLFAADPKITRRFVGKNVCHTIVYNKDIQLEHEKHEAKGRAGMLFREAMRMYLDEHWDKKFHDPAAAVCHLHPEIGTWIKGDLFRQKGGWGTRLGGNDDMLVDIDREKLWQHIFVGD